MFWMTQSLLNSWLYFMNAEELYSDRALDDLFAALRREKREKTRAMQDGIRFERMVNAAVSGGAADDPPNERWRQAAERFAGLCSGGQRRAWILFSTASATM